MRPARQGRTGRRIWRRAGAARRRGARWSGRANVLVETEQVARVVAALDQRELLERSARIRAPDPIVALGPEEIDVDTGPMRGEGVVERARPGIGRSRIAA